MTEENRVISFRTQRVAVTLGFFVLAFVGTTSVLWHHIENIMGTGIYGSLAKAGLLLLPAVGIATCLWELFVDDNSKPRKHPSHRKVKRFIAWCFCASWGLLVLEVVHSGALLKYESSMKAQAEAIKNIGDAQAKIAGSTTAAAIESSGKAAQRMNATGQPNLARTTIKTGKAVAGEATAAAQKEVERAAKEAAPTTFFSEWYINGGMYAALPSLAALILAITMALARAAQPYVDKDDDGKPDEPQEEITQTEIELPK